MVTALRTATSASAQFVIRFRSQARLALLGLAILAAISHVIVQSSLISQEGASLMINQAGRMRAQSQRLALLGKVLQDDPQTEASQAWQDVQSNREQLSASWSEVQGYVAGLSDNKQRRLIQSQLNQARVPLDALFASVESASDDPRGFAEHADQVLLHANQFLPLMDAAVTELERYAEQSLIGTERWNWVMFGLTLLALFVIKWSLFRPAALRMAALIQEVRTKGEHLAARLTSLQRFAGGMAHVYNNIIFQIQGCAEILQKDYNETHLTGIQLRSCSRAAKITSQLVAYAGNAELSIQQTDLTDVVRSTISGMSADNEPERIQFQVRDQITVQAAIKRLAMAVEALIKNALEAVSETKDEADWSGRVCVSIERRRLHKAMVTSEPYNTLLPPGEYAAICVKDNGKGISDEVRERVFDPFSSSKFLGRGLGLAAALGIAQAHGGGILLEERDGLLACVMIPILEQQLAG